MDQYHVDYHGSSKVKVVESIFNFMAHYTHPGHVKKAKANSGRSTVNTVNSFFLDTQ